ncbi:MAG: hypothetical protein IMF01_09480 [Proteobacteria bacterium]|nr:hypothetical protein [Pseudomonadota bacterium]
MAKLRNMSGELIGKVRVAVRGPDSLIGDTPRVQWFCDCTVCDKRFLVIAKDLTRYKSRYRKGCDACSNLFIRPKVKFTFGRNANGFIDRSKVIEVTA